MKLNKEKEYLVEKVYDRVEILHNKNLRELIDSMSKSKELEDLDELTNEVKRINTKINIQCFIVEMIMQEDWSLEEVQTLDWLLRKKEDTLLKDLTRIIIEDNVIEGHSSILSKFKLILKTLKIIGDVRDE